MQREVREQGRDPDEVVDERVVPGQRAGTRGVYGAAVEVDDRVEAGEHERHVLHPFRQAERPPQIGPVPPQEVVADEHGQERGEIPDVREGVDLDGAAHEHDGDHADEVEPHRSVRHAVLVRVLEEARELAVYGHLVQRSRRSRDRIQRREHESHDEHAGDQPVEGIAAPAEDRTCVVDEDRLRVGRDRRPEHQDEGDRDHRVDEDSVAALEIHRDLRVAVRVLRLADVAGCRLHRDHVPCEQERKGDVDGQPPVTEERREEARPVRLLEALQIRCCRRGRVEDPGDGDERQRDHREKPEHGREHRAEPDSENRGNEDDSQPDDRDYDRPVSDGCVDGREPLLREVELVDEVEGSEDHVQRTDGKPAEPVRPGGEAVDVLRGARPAVLVGRIGVRRRASHPLRHHRGELCQEEAQEPTGQGDDHDARNRRRSELRHHYRGDPGYEDGAGEPDDERAPPVRLPR